MVLSFDEKWRTPVKQYGGMKWDSNKHYRISYNQKVNGLFDIFAVKNVHTRERHYRYYDWKNSFIVIDFIDWLSTNVYPDKEIYLILDNWSAHRSNAFNAYVDLHPRIHPVYLPTTASWINDIERDYSRIQKEALNNSNFDSPKEAMSMISFFFKNILNSS